MFAEMLSPETLPSQALDDFLAQGWFRMRQSIFTTHFLHFQSKFYSAIWLRVDLEKIANEPKFKELQKRNRHFTIEVKEAIPDRVHEILFAAYRASLDFDTSDNLRQLLFGYDAQNLFRTFEINLYDQGKLIASGYFDLGKNSAAGITSFYDPAYKKHSLGKYLIYCKVDYCRQLGLHYFYPGYTAPGYGMFDYKLEIGKTAMEYYSLEKLKWVVYKSESFAITALQSMHNHLSSLQRLVHKKKGNGKVVYYRYFDARLDPFFESQPLLDYPVFLSHKYLTDIAQYQVVVFNISKCQFELLQCSSIYQMENFEGGHGIFNSDLLQVEEIVATAGTAEEMTWMLV